MINQIRDEIKKLQHHPDPSKFDFTLWSNTDCDEACNFKDYFPKFNSSKLDEKIVKSVLMNFTRNVMKKIKRK